MNKRQRVELVEEGVPLEAIRGTAEEIVELVGGTIDSSGDNEIRFSLPSRRGMSSGPTAGCLLSWDEVNGGTVRLIAEQQNVRPALSQIVLLGTGVAGAFLWLLWPFFPNLGAAAWIGGALAIGTYLLSQRITPVGTASEILQRIVRRQRGE